MYGRSEGKGVYGRYRSVLSNFATLKRVTDDNATVGACVGGLYPNPCYIFKVYSMKVVYIIAWRGLAALLILNTGQCEGLIVGMGEGRISHAFFILS